jgi:hypothetical protein
MGGGRDLFPTPHSANLLNGLPNLLSNGYRGLFPGGEAAYTTHVSTERTLDAEPPIPLTSSWHDIYF